MRAIGTVLLLVLSNIFMTFAWYGLHQLAADSGHPLFMGTGFL